MQTGTFRLQENSFIAGNRKFVIRERKKPTTKPKLFLIQLSPFQYVSSLFPSVSESEYTFDFESKLYSLRKVENEKQVEIIELE